MQLSTMVTIVLGFSTCVSPVLVASINSKHARKLRKIELDAAESLKKIELNAELSREFALSDRDLKYKVMFNFIDVASCYLLNYNDIELYSKLRSAYSKCVALGFQWSALEGYMQYVKPPSEDFSLSDSAMEQMRYFLEDIADNFSESLKKTLNSAFIE